MQALLGALGAVWGVTGVVALLGYAIQRLTPIAMEAGQAPLSTLHWFALGMSIAFFGYTEGYKAFQKQFSPRVVARALAIAEHPTFARVLLAPAFAMGFFGATRKRLTVSYCLSAGILVLIVLMRSLAQPWRGIVDVGVVLALAWGIASILVFAARAWFGHAPSIPTDIPPETRHRPIDELVVSP